MISLESIDAIFIKIINKIVRLFSCVFIKQYSKLGFLGHYFLKTHRKTPNLQNLKILNKKINHFKKFAIKNLNQNVLKKENTLHTRWLV